MLNRAKMSGRLKASSEPSSLTAAASIGGGGRGGRGQDQAGGAAEPLAMGEGEGRGGGQAGAGGSTEPLPLEEAEGRYDGQLESEVTGEYVATGSVCAGTG